jgi:hypothetical protein
MCGLPSSWSWQRLQAGCYEHISETIGFHMSPNSWTVERLLAFQEGVCFLELVMYVNAFGGQARDHICGVWPQLCSQICLKAGPIFMYPFSFRLLSYLYWSVINVLSSVHLDFSLWGKDKSTGQGSVIWREWIEGRQTEGCISQRVRCGSYCGADQIEKNILDRKFIAHGGQIVYKLLTVKTKKKYRRIDYIWCGRH